MSKTKLAFSQADDDEYASQQELDQVKDNNTDTFVPTTMNNKVLHTSVALNDTHRTSNGSDHL